MIYILNNLSNKIEQICLSLINMNKTQHDTDTIQHKSLTSWI